MVSELNKSEESKKSLPQTLEKFLELFGGGLGKLRGVQPAHITLKPGAKPHSSSYYNIPKSMEKQTRKEIDRMCEIDVLEKLHWYDDSPWGAPTFGVPKKTGDIRIVTDFRKMNAQIEQQPFPLPRIIETMQRLEKFKSATALDLSQGFYTIPIDKESQKICTTILPWGKYSYKRLPMGICQAPFLFQSVLMELLADLEYVLVYIDDILIVQREDESKEDHLAKIEVVLQRLQDAGFRANLRKSFFMQTKIDYLGYQLTSEGLECQPKKIEAMERILPPRNVKELKRYIGMVNFYRDCFEKRSQVLAPLTELAAECGKHKGSKAKRA